MMVKKEIETLDDIKTMVDNFYEKVRQDDLLGVIFNAVVADRWPEHLAKMYRFWQTILLKEHTYSGSPFPPHMKLPVQKEHFDRWKNLFNETVDAGFCGVKAEEAKWRAERMAVMFQSKIDYYKSTAGKPLI